MGTVEDANLPWSLVRSSPAGTRYVPQEGEHAGHVVVLVSRDALRFNILGEPLRSWLVRCEKCLISWTFASEDGCC